MICETKKYDAIVLGGGPTGSTAAYEMARRGLSVLLLEKSEFPRFRIGESFLPETYLQLKEMGLEQNFLDLPHVEKLGGSFTLGHGLQEPVDFWFKNGMVSRNSTSFNVERAPFDLMLLNAARDAGAEVCESEKVLGINRLEDDDVEIVSTSGVKRARFLVDATGGATVVARHLGTKVKFPELSNVGYFAHFSGVQRNSGEQGGFARIVMCEDAWFWLIPIDDERTSVGVVADHKFVKRVNVSAGRFLDWAIKRCPVMAELCENAIACEPNELPAGANHVEADFSYQCKPYAGPGYFLCGDAATFIDPVFSTGVCLGMRSGEDAAKSVSEIIQKQSNPARCRRGFSRRARSSSKPMFKLVRMFYRHQFRELFLFGKGPLSLHGAVLEVLRGNVFPKPRFAVTWRFNLFIFFCWLQRFVSVTPALEKFWLETGSVDSPAQNEKRGLGEKEMKLAE